MCRFIELLTHTKGELAGQRIKLEPWQVFILTTAFGWRRREDGGRRFRRVYIEVARGNGKSCLSSGVALYCLVADNEPGAEVYSFATTRDQAKIVFGDAKRMAETNLPLRKRFGLEVLANALYVPSTGSTFQAKSAEGSTLDGLNTHLAVVDELHAHKTRAVYDVVETSLGKRRSSLLWCITTAGFDTSGICYEVRTMSTRVLERQAVDETQFAIIYTADEEDNWTTLEALEKANPNWGVSVRPEMILSLLAKAKALPSAINNFKTKHLDIWCSASNAWMDMGAWAQCEDHSLRLEDFEGERCIIGLDLGSKNDMTAKVKVFPIETDGPTRYAIFCDFYLPERAVENAVNSQYSGWAEEGLLHVTPGAMTDLNVVEEDLREDLSRFNVEAVVYDPWQATQMATTLSEDDAPMVECRMTVQNMSDPMKSVEALVLDRRLLHDGNPILTWMMGNVVAKLDAKDNIFPRKERYEQKIDGVIALIMAMGNALADDNDDFKGFVESGQETFFEW
ncbi:terminase large subunit [Sutterella wadsworthensis]|uniref:terminase large subunit n=1 Tax=Sutterella wadsworthensis TaxID=40545 RepID=UPI00241BF8FF|nr:terminase TerL endonuclease subunit [Sutterella wadsworthensis]